MSTISYTPKFVFSTGLFPSIMIALKGGEVLSPFKTIEQAIHALAHTSRVTIADGARELKVGESHLYRLFNPTDSGANFPARLLVPSMRAFKGIQPLRWMAGRMEFLLVRPPVGRWRRAISLSEYQVHFVRLVELIMRLFEGEKEIAPMAMQYLHDHLEHTAHLKALCSKDINQLELNL